MISACKWMNGTGLPWSERTEPVSPRSKILVGGRRADFWEINKKRDLSLSYLAQDSRFESSNTIYDEMLMSLTIFVRRRKVCGRWSWEMGGEKLRLTWTNSCRIMTVYRKNSVKLVVFTYEADIERFSTASSLMSLCGR